MDSNVSKMDAAAEDAPIGKLLAIAEASEEENLPKLNFDPNMHQSLRLN